MNRFGRSESTREPVHRRLNGLVPGQWAGTVSRDLKTGVQSAEGLIGNWPLAALCIGFVAGVVVGYWVKRT